MEFRLIGQKCCLVPGDRWNVCDNGTFLVEGLLSEENEGCWGHLRTSFWNLKVTRGHKTMPKKPVPSVTLLGLHDSSSPFLHRKKTLEITLKIGPCLVVGFFSAEDWL